MKYVTEIENHSIQLHKCSDINKQEYDQTGTSNPNMHKISYVASLSLVLHPIKLFKLGMVSEFIRDCLSRLQSELPTSSYFLPIPGCTFNILEQGYIPTSHHNVHTCVAKFPNKKI